MLRYSLSICHYALIVLSCFVSADAQTAPPSLIKGEPVVRQLSESPVFLLRLNADQFVRVKVEPHSAVFMTKLIGPDGKAILEVSSPNKSVGKEGLWYIAEHAAEYRIEITAFDGKADGAVEIELLESRFATTADQDATAKYIGNVARTYFGRDNVRCRLLAERSLDLARSASNEKIVANEFNLIANTYLMEGFLDKGRDLHLKALAIRRGINDTLGISLSLNNLGILYSNLGDANRAIDSFSQSYELMLKEGLKEDSAVSLYNIGIVHMERGDIGEAMVFFQRSAATFQSAGMEQMPPDLALNFASAYRRIGNFALAIRYLNDSILGFKRSKSKYGLMQSLDGLGRTYLETGDHEKAANYFEQALEVERKMSAGPSVKALQAAGEAYVISGNIKRADELYEQALAIASKDSPVLPLASLKLSIAKLRLKQGKNTEALVMAKEAQVISERLSSRILSSELYATLARIYLNGNDNERAEEYFKYAVREDDDARASWIADEESASNLFGSRISPYYNLMELYTRSGRSADAFELSERMRSRTIVDAFRNAKIDISRAMSPEERTRESDLKLALISLNERLSKMGELSKESSAPLIEELRLKRLEFDDFRNRLHAAHPELQVHRGEMKPIALEEAASVLTDDKCTVLEYAVADDKTLLFVITIEPSNKPQLSSFVIDVKRADLLQKVEQYRQEIGQGKLGHKSQAQALYDLLLRPAASKLLGRSRLIIIPDGPLWDLPFQALQDGGKSLIERSAVSYAPSLTALREMTRTTRSRRTGGDFELFAVGNPMVGKATSDKVERVFMAEKLTPLPEAERLANELGKMYGRRRSNVYTGDAARESVVKSEAPHYRIVQFATHGILNDTNPMYSHIVLAQNNKDPNEDGLLEAWELKDLDLNADMVILSACETARGKISNGEGVIGMTWASFIAGAPTTVASQWKVESRSTTELMLEFHRQLLAKKKVSKAEALRRASLKVMKMPGFQHPSYWAGFVIVGDGS